MTDSLPSEPGKYDGFQAVFGAKYIAPAIGGGPNHFNAFGHRVTDANGNLVDLNGNTLAEPFTNTPGFPGFSPTATQSLAVMADMQEAGTPVTYGDIPTCTRRRRTHGRAAPPPRTRQPPEGWSAWATVRRGDAED